MNFVRNLKNALLNNVRNCFNKSSCIEDPKIIMTILAKNEIDIIEKNLIFHKSMGVDGFIVTDNGSEDGTVEVFEKYKKRGWIKEIIYEKNQDYSQSKWVDRMIRIAISKYGADWIINADADEFWVSKSGNIKSEISKCRMNVLKCPIYNILPADEIDFVNNDLMVVKSFDISKYDLAKYNIFSLSIPKVAHRAKNYKMIHMGNHGVDMVGPSVSVSKDIVIYHYNVRSCEHFKNKMVTGGAAYERNLKFGKDVGSHWRYFYSGYINGEMNLDLQYEKYIGRKYWEEYKRKGYLVKAELVKNYFLHNIKVNEKDI